MVAAAADVDARVEPLAVRVEPRHPLGAEQRHQGPRVLPEPGRLEVGADAQLAAEGEVRGRREVGVRDHPPPPPDADDAIGVGIGPEQLVHRRLARAVGRHAPAASGRLLGENRQRSGLDEEQAPVIRLGDLVRRPDAPGRPHVGRPVEHPAVEEDLQRADADPVVAHARSARSARAPRTSAASRLQRPRRSPAARPAGLSRTRVALTRTVSSPRSRRPR